MPLKYLEDNGYTGINKDTPAWLLEKGELSDGLNLLFDRPGVARQRNGSTWLNTAGSASALATTIGFCYSQDSASSIEELYGYNPRNGVLSRIDSTNGTPTPVFTSPYLNSRNGRSFRHFGFVYFPAAYSDGRRVMIAAGQTVTQNAFNGTAVAQVVAQNPQITLTGADVTTNFKVGALVHIFTAARDFTARIVSIDSSKLFSVWPKPDFTDAAVGVNQCIAGAASQIAAGACGTSFQNRLLFGNCMEFQAALGKTIWDRRVYYSPLQTEPQGPISGVTYSGSLFNNTGVWPQFNYFEVPGADPIVAIEPIADNELLVLTTTHPVIFRGNLATQLATTSPTVTFDILDVNMPAGCASDHSVQRTTRGVMWASAGGVYTLSGSGEPVNVLEGKMANYWRGLGNQPTFSIHGSFYARGHYYVCGAAGGQNFGLLVNLGSRDARVFSFSLLDNVDIHHAVARPSNSMQNFAIRWMDYLGSAPGPSWNNGQVMRIESIFDHIGPASVARLDSDGTSIPFNLTTRSLMGDQETQKIQARSTVRYQQSITDPASTTVRAGTKIDPTEVEAWPALYPLTLGYLTSTIGLGVGDATNATPIVVTLGSAHGFGVGDYVDVYGIGGNLNANGRWRISAVTATTITLQGSSGSGAYTSGGQVKKLSESDFATAQLEQGQGVWFVIASGPTNPSFFELHGLRVAFYEREPVMSA